MSQTILSSNFANTNSAFTATDLGQHLRALGDQASVTLNSQFARNPLSSAAISGLGAGFFTSYSLFQSRPVSADLLQGVARELARLVPLCFVECQRTPGLCFSNALSQAVQKSSHRELLQLYLNSSTGMQLLSLCDRAVLEGWSETRLTESFVTSQYQGINRESILRTFTTGLRYICGDHSSSNRALLFHAYQNFMGNTEDRGTNFARVILNAYRPTELSSSLRNYVEREGVLSGIAQSANFSGIASSLSGRMLSMALIGVIARSPASIVVKIGSALLCGAASSLGQVGFQTYWATRNMSSSDRFNYIAGMEWQLKSALVTGMFCGASELLGARILGSSSNFIIQTLKTFTSFSLFNVSAEMASDAAMNRLGIAAAYVQANQEDALGPQTFLGQWAMGAGQEMIGDHTAQVTTPVIEAGIMSWGVLTAVAYGAASTVQSPSLVEKVTSDDFLQKWVLGGRGYQVVDLRSSEERNLQGDITFEARARLNITLARETQDEESWDVEALANELENSNLNMDVPIFFICSEGNRSFHPVKEALRLLRWRNSAARPEKCYSLAGGMNALLQCVPKNSDSLIFLKVRLGFALKAKKLALIFQQNHIRQFPSIKTEKTDPLEEVHSLHREFMDPLLPEVERIYAIVQYIERAVGQFSEEGTLMESSPVNVSEEEFHQAGAHLLYLAQNASGEVAAYALAALALLESKLPQTLLTKMLNCVHNTSFQQYFSNREFVASYALYLRPIEINSAAVFEGLERLLPHLQNPNVAIRYFLLLYQKLQAPVPQIQLKILVRCLSQLRKKIIFERSIRRFRGTTKKDGILRLDSTPEWRNFKRIQFGLVELIRESVKEDESLTVDKSFPNDFVIEISNLLRLFYTLGLGLEKGKSEPWLWLAENLERDLERETLSYRRIQVGRFYAELIQALVQKQNERVYFSKYRSELQRLSSHLSVILEGVEPSDPNQIATYLESLESLEDPANDLAFRAEFNPFPLHSENFQKMSIDELFDWIRADQEFQIIDLRKEHEVEEQGKVSFQGVRAVNLPLENLEEGWNVEKLAEDLEKLRLNTNAPVVFICSLGGRSFEQAQEALHILKRRASQQRPITCYSLAGGIQALLGRTKQVAKEEALSKVLELQPGPAYFARLQIQHLLTQEAEVRKLYLAHQPDSLDNIENFAHVSRLRQFAEQEAKSMGLTRLQFLQLRVAMAYSDVGKNMPWVNSGFHQLFEKYHNINSPGQIEASHLSEAHPHLDGLVDWLRVRQAQSGLPLQLKVQEKNAALTALQETWGNETFEVNANRFAPISADERLQALRFYKTVFDGKISLFPMGMYFHEVVGHTLAYAKGGQEHMQVTNAFLGHNGPDRIYDETGKPLPKEQFLFWRMLNDLVVEGAYPFPPVGNILAVAHTLFDRLDQGTLVEENGTFQGGVRKIFIQEMIQKKRTPFEAAQNLFTALPRGSAQQIHALWFERCKGTALEGRMQGTYERTIAALNETSSLVELIDFEASKARDESENTLVFRDGTTLVLDTNIHRNQAINQFVVELFKLLAQKKPKKARPAV